MERVLGTDVFCSQCQADGRKDPGGVLARRRGGARAKGLANPRTTRHRTDTCTRARARALTHRRSHKTLYIPALLREREPARLYT